MCSHYLKILKKIKKDVKNKIKINLIQKNNQILMSKQKQIDDTGANYDQAPWTMGGETSFSRALREYISLATISKTDKYGQETIEAVDFRKIYRGLTRALAGTEEENILPRIKALAEFDEDINALYIRFKQDLGLSSDNNNYTDINC